MNLTLYPKPLSGIVTVPSSKSIMHRLIICASFAKGNTIINHPLLCDDTLFTINALKQIGVAFDISQEKLIIYPPKNYLIPLKPIECGNSGSTLRFLLPIMGFLFNSSSFHGTSRLIKRLVVDDLHHLPMEYSIFDETLSITKFQKNSIITISDENTTQFISGLIMASAITNNPKIQIITTNNKFNQYITLTLNVIKHLGTNYTINNSNGIFTVIINEDYPGNHLHGTEITIEGDYSSGANLLCMGILGDKVITKGLFKDSFQPDSNIVNILKSMGGNIEVGYDVITSSISNLKGRNFDLNEYPDLGPLLMAMGTISNGKSIYTGLHKLELKESNRLLDTINILKSLGAKIELKDNQVIIIGQEKLMGGVTIDPKDDHRLVMMVAVLTNKFIKRVEIINAECVKKSYPSFWEHYRLLKGVAIDSTNQNHEKNS